MPELNQEINVTDSNDNVKFVEEDVSSDSGTWKKITANPV